MSIKLPAMRMLCFRWCLPAPIAEGCDYYFLDRPSFPDFASSLHMKEGRLHITKHGVDFEVVFQNDSEVLYAECLKKELQGDPCVQVTFWCSFRSMTFEFGEVSQTRSVVLVQPARDKVRSREPKEVDRHTGKLRWHGAKYGTQLVTADYLGDVSNLPITEEKAAELVKTFREMYPHTTTFADRVANSLDKMENENDNT